MKLILREIKDKICILTINRPDQLNALNSELITDLDEKISRIQERTDIRAIILKGEGEKAFIAGADISEMNLMTKKEALKFSKIGQELTLKIENSHIPIIAAINGFALGGGCEFAMACHIRIASENALFGQPEVGLGLIAGFGGTQRLARLIGKGLAMELLLTGKHIDAKRAKEIGLVNEIYSKEQLHDKSVKLAKIISAKSPLAIKQTLLSINQVDNMGINDGLKLENSLFAELFDSNDAKEGLSAFMNKITPKFNDLK